MGGGEAAFFIRRLTTSVFLGFRLRLVFLLGLRAQALEIALHHFAGRLGHALLLDGFGRLLAGLFDLSKELGFALLLEVLARCITVKNLLALGIKLDFCLGLKGAKRFLFAKGASPGSLTVTVGVLIEVAVHRLALLNGVQASILSVLETGE